MSRKRTRRPKRITQQQITGQQGVNLVEGMVLKMGFVWHPTNAGLEAGIDGIIEIRDPETGEATNNIIQVQVKTTHRRWVNENRKEFVYRCENRDIDYWMQSNTPVLLIAVRPEGDEAYWANVKVAFADPKQRRDGRMRFDKKTQRFDASAAPMLMKLAVPQDYGPYLPAPLHDETLTSNLLKVERFPFALYNASTNHRRAQEIFDWAKESDIQLPSGWLLTEKSIRSAYDLSEYPWTELVDQGTVERFDIEEWSDSDDPDRQREFVWLMNSVLRDDMSTRGLWHWRSGKERCFYFPTRRDADNTPLPRQFSYRSLSNRTSREVVKIHRRKETGEVVYCRHSAMKWAFLRAAGHWVLAIVPHYVYTTDGRTPYPYGEDLLSGMKRMEHQDAVLGQIVMWRYKLTHIPRRGLFSKRIDREPMIVFGELLQAECNRGVADEDWRITDDVAFKSGIDDWGLF